MYFTSKCIVNMGFKLTRNGMRYGNIGIEI